MENTPFRLFFTPVGVIYVSSEAGLTHEDT